MKVRVDIEVVIIDGQTSLGYEVTLDTIEAFINQLMGVQSVEIKGEEIE